MVVLAQLTAHTYKAYKSIYLKHMCKGYELFATIFVTKTMMTPFAMLFGVFIICC